jgi:hypothetical protein
MNIYKTNVGLFACIWFILRVFFQMYISLGIGRENLLHKEFGRKLNDTLMTFFYKVL